MKKITSILITLVLSFSLVSCSDIKTPAVDTNTDEPVNTSSSSNIETPGVDTNTNEFTNESSSENANDDPLTVTDNYHITELPLNYGLGTLSIDDIPNNTVKRIDTVKSIYPIYKCKYPIDLNEGPKFEITDEDIALMEKRLDDFLPLLNGADTEADLVRGEYSGINLSINSYGKDLTIVSSVMGINIGVDNYMISEDTIKNSPENDPYLKAAIEYLGFDKYSVSDGVPDVSGTFVAYTITKTEDNKIDEMLNSHFKKIRVSTYADLNSVIIVAYDIDNSPEEAIECNVIPYDIIENYILEKYPDTDIENIFSYVYYNSSVVDGYYVPTYRFYLGSAKEDSIEFRISDIVMVNYDFGTSTDK